MKIMQATEAKNRFGELLEDAISDKQSAFLEPSFVGAFVISRRIGSE